MPLKAPLPDHLEWLTEKVEQLIRPAAFLCPDKSRAPARGATQAWGPPDLPADAPWAQGMRPDMWQQSWHDGPVFALQLELAGIPAEARKPIWPAQGVVWVFFDASDPEAGWKAWAEFDPRPASDIPWQPRAQTAYPVKASTWALADTLTCATDESLPEIAWDYHGGVGMGVDYDEWWQKHYGCRLPSTIQVGGWIHPIQGGYAPDGSTLVCAMERLEFGDNGAIYLHHCPAKGFSVSVHTH